MSDNRLAALPAQDYIETILDQLDDGIYITDSEANTVYLNHSYELISGLPKSEMIGQNMKELVERGTISESGTLTVLQSGEKVTINQRFRTGKQAVITSIPITENAGEREMMAGIPGTEDAGECETAENQTASSDTKTSGETAARPHIIMVLTIVREITEQNALRRELRIKESRLREYLKKVEDLTGEQDASSRIIAEDARSAEMLRLAGQAARVRTPVLLTGEPGSGKSTIAKYMHDHSDRANGPFYRIGSGAGQFDLEAYLFGRADETKDSYEIGLLESVNGGTLYIEELTDIPPVLLEKLMPVLRGESCLMGDGSMRRLDIRVISASRYALSEIRRRFDISEKVLDAAAGFEIRVPALRERADDIVPFAEFFLQVYCEKSGQVRRIDPAGYEKLRSGSWPGNIHELKNAITQAAIVSDRETITAEELRVPGNGSAAAARGAEQAASDSVLADSILSNSEGSDQNPFGSGTLSVNLKEESAKLEAFYMNRAFAAYGNVRAAAEHLGIDSSTFVRKRQRYQEMGLMD